MGFFDKFLGKKEKEPEITPENSKGKIVRTHYDDQGMVKKREVYKEPRRFSFKMSPERKKEFSEGAKKIKKGFEKADRGAQRLNRAFDEVAEHTSDMGLFGDSMFGSGPAPKRKKGKNMQSGYDFRWM